MEKFNKAMLSIDEKFNSLLDECRAAIKQAFIDNVRIINTARFTIINNEGSVIVIDPLEDVKQNLDEIRSADKLMDIITEISYTK